MILYYSGTGNSWMIANRIGEWMGQIPVSMNRRIKDGCTEQVSVNEKSCICDATVQYYDAQKCSRRRRMRILFERPCPR